MSGIPIRQFLGIAPYLDKRDLSENYAAEALNVTFKRSYCKSEYLKATMSEYSAGGSVLYYGIVTLATDPLMNQISGNKLVPYNYYNTENFILVLEKQVSDYLRIGTFLYQDGGYFREEYLLGEYNIPISHNVIVNVVEDRGTVKIFIRDTTANQGYTYQMSVSSRYLYMFQVDQTGNYTYANTRFTGPDMPPTWNPDPKGIYINRLMEGYDKTSLGLGPDGALLGSNKLGLDFNVNVVTQNIPTDIKNVYFTQVGQLTTTYNNDFYPIKVFELLDTMDTPDVNDDENIERFEPEWDWNGQVDKYEHWAWIQFRENQDYRYMLIPENYFSATGIYPVDDDGNRIDVPWPIIEYPNALHIHQNGEHHYNILAGKWYEVLISEFNSIRTKWKLAGDYIGGSSGVGFETQYNKAELVATMILDRRDEYVVCRKRLFLGTGGDRFAFRIRDLKIPFDTVNKRLTGWAMYLRFSDSEDFQQVKFVDMLSTNDKYDNFYIHSLSPNGIFLKQTIGTLYNYDNHWRLGAVDEYRRVAGINYALANGKIYGPPTGNGQLLDIYYEESVIPDTANNEILHISDLNNTLAIHTQNYMKIIVAQDGGDGIILYFVKDGLQLGIKNKFDVIEVADGIFINSKDGLHFTNGETHVEIGSEVKNIIEEKHSTSRIFYNEVMKHLYLITKSTDTTLYIYSLIDKSWNSYNTNFFNSGGVIFDRIEELFFDDEGIAYLTTNLGTSSFKLFKYEFKTEGEGYIKYSFDFKQLPGWKIILGLLLDYKGITKWYNPATSQVEDYISYLNPVTNEIERATQMFYYSLDERIPERYIEFLLPVKNDTTVYNIDVQIDQVAEDDI